MSASFTKEVSESLDYTLDWSLWLAGGETILTSVWTVPSGLTVGSASSTTTTTTQWLSGGTNGTRYDVSCHVTTSNGRSGDKTFSLLVQDTSISRPGAVTAQTLIERAMRLAGILASGETPTGPEANDALITLNSLLEEWSLQGLTVHARSRTTKTLVANQSVYTIGETGADITILRPLRIETATRINTSADPDSEEPMVIVDEAGYAALSPKALTAEIPTHLYYNPTYPTGTITLWPVPTSTDYDLCLYLPAPLAAAATLASDLDLPPGYEKALRYNLAVELCPEYGRVVDPAVLMQAQRSLANVKRMNFRPDVLSCDPALLLAHGGSMDIETGS